MPHFIGRKVELNGLKALLDKKTVSASHTNRVRPLKLCWGVFYGGGT